ncbi:protoporphyrinogen oxidase [Streptomyces sp. NPDC051561]|uniref:protoporphyrinogen oxidase n=1 Tax=Streptomyces sp. NPDC051561 TaxID=3365658 RepID=UPI00379B8A58
MNGTDATAPTTPHVVVIGGGISGLAAAHRLIGSGARVTVLEATDRLGGKLSAGEIAGAPVDFGAESMLARRPEAVALAREVGLGERLRPPSTASASLWNRGALTPMPKGHVMGVPGDPSVLTAVLSAAALARAEQDRTLPRTEVGDDMAIGEYVAARLGREVVDRLVEPLLGGVYAGDVYRTSMRAAVPALYDAATSYDSLLEGVQELQRRTAANQQTGPVFMGIDGGIGTLPDAVAAAVRAGGGRVLTETPVLDLAREGGRWRIRTDEAVFEADGVVLAAPAWSASALLAEESPAASAELSAVEYASMALVTMAFSRKEVEAVLPAGSGFLVPPVDGHTIKASTFSTHKWGWVDQHAPDLFVLRTSVGRYGEEEHLHRDDADLVEVSLHDLGAATGLAAAPVETRVTRWIGGLPQYPVGHLGRVSRIRDAVAKLPGLRVCGAAYDGVGIPACVGSGQRAATEIIDEILATPTLVEGTANGAGQ